MATPQLDETVLLDMDSRIASGEKSIDDINDPEARRQYLEWKASRPEEERGFLSKAVGVAGNVLGALEPALTIGTGIVAQPVAGLAGLKTLATGGTLDEAVETIQNVSGNLTYQPRSRVGRAELSALATAMEPIERGMEFAGRESAEATGSPLIGAGVRTLLEVGPSFFGVRNPASVLRSRRQGINEANRLLREAGIEVSPSLVESVSVRGIPSTGRVAEIFNQVPEAAAALSGSTSVRAQGLNSIQSAVQNARRTTREAISQMYDQATDAGTVVVPVNEVRILNESLANSMAGFEMANIGPVRNLLSEFTSIIEPPPQRFSNVNVSRSGIGRAVIARDVDVPQIPVDDLRRSIVELNDISAFRRKLSLAERGNNPEVSAAATLMKKEIDEWMNAQFDSDMMSGSADAIAKWKNANSAYREYSKIFKENKSMEMMFREEATPEMIQNWIYGTSAVGASNEAALVVRRLNQVVGRNSAEMQTLRNSAAFDIVYPLIRNNLDADSLNQFRLNYTDFVRKNSSLAQELFSPEQLEAFQTLSRTVSSAKDIAIESPRLLGNIDRTLAIALFPKAQPLSAGARFLDIAENSIKRLKSFGRRSEAKKLYSDLTGVDLSQPLFSARTPAVAAFIQTAQDQPDEFDQVYSYLTQEQ